MIIVTGAHYPENRVCAFRDGRAEELVGLLDEYGKGVGHTEIRQYGNIQ